MAKSELDKVITAKRAKEAERKANEEHFRSMPVIANPGSYAPAPESLKTDIALKTQGKSSVQNSIPV